MSDSYKDVEERITVALRAIQNNEAPNISAAARQFNVPPQRLRNRFHGRPAKTDLPGFNRRFSDEEERALCHYLDRLDRMGLPAQQELLRAAADSILMHGYTPDLDDPEDKPPRVSDKWVSRFLKRHPQYTIVRQKTLDIERKQAEGYKALEEWFNLYKDVCNRYGVLNEDTWNMDETGFCIGVGRDQLVITKQKRQLYLGVPTNRELATAVETISGGGCYIPVFLILAGARHMARWYQDSNLDPNMAVSLSDSGYTNDRLSLEWLYHFNNHTKKGTIGAKRLLLLDGYGSHHTLEFINYCDENGIIPFAFPPHTTHILQPLDVVVFQQYKHYHTKAIDIAVRDGCSKITKLEFLAAISDVRRQAFKKSTIHSAFAKTGLIPFNPNVVLQKIRPVTPPAPETGLSSTVATPLTIRNLKRHADYLYQNAPADNPEFSNVLDRFIRGSIIQGTELQQAMKDLNRSKLAEEIRQKRRAYNNKPLQTGGVLTVAHARAMVQRQEEDERAKAEAVLQRLDEKERKLHQKASNEAAKKAREWRNKGIIKPVYIVDREGSGRYLIRC